MQTKKLKDIYEKSTAFIEDFKEALEPKGQKNSSVKLLDY